MSKKYLGLILILVLISGLILYNYFVNVDNNWNYSQDSNWNYKQLQKINKTESNYSFVVYGDNRDSAGKFEHLIQNVNQKDVLFSIDNGDLVSSGTMGNFKSFLSEIRKSKAPILTVIGNHELYEDSDGSNYIKLFGKPYYSFTEKNSYFIILDDANSKSFDDVQMEWLKNELKKSQKYKYRFVFMHIPLYDPRGNSTGKSHSLDNLTIAKNLNDLFDQYNVTMLFTSHIHGYFQGVWGKTPFIVTGGAGAPLSTSYNQNNNGSVTNNYFYNYILVNVTNKGVNYTTVRYN